MEQLRGSVALFRTSLVDPRVRLSAGSAGLVLAAVMVSRGRVGRREECIFLGVNGLPDSLFTVAWGVMQLGNVGAAPAAAAVALAAGDRGLARRLLVGGTASWALSKVVKQAIRRPRPAMLLPYAHCRGRAAAGLGFLSGHAAVAVALGTAALPRLRGPSRIAVLTAVPTVGLARIYVGAHLPLDVVGGAALGLAVEAALELGRAGDPAHSPHAGPPRGPARVGGARMPRFRRKFGAGPDGGPKVTWTDGGVVRRTARTFASTPRSSRRPHWRHGAGWRAPTPAGRDAEPTRDGTGGPMKPGGIAANGEPGLWTIS